MTPDHNTLQAYDDLHQRAEYRYGRYIALRSTTQHYVAPVARFVPSDVHDPRVGSSWKDRRKRK